MDEITLAKSEIQLRHWQKLIDACQTSGMTVKAWCEANDVSDKSYYYWLKKVRKRALETSGMPVPIPEPSPAAIVPLEVTAPAVSGTAAVVLHIQDAVIEIAPGADQLTLEAVLRALRSTC